MPIQRSFYYRWHPEPEESTESRDYSSWSGWRWGKDGLQLQIWMWSKSIGAAATDRRMNIGANPSQWRDTRWRGFERRNLHIGGFEWFRVGRRKKLEGMRRGKDLGWEWRKGYSIMESGDCEVVLFPFFLSTWKFANGHSCWWNYLCQQSTQIFGEICPTIWCQSENSYPPNSHRVRTHYFHWLPRSHQNNQIIVTSCQVVYPRQENYISLMLV